MNTIKYQSTLHRLILWIALAIAIAGKVSAQVDPTWETEIFTLLRNDKPIGEITARHFNDGADQKFEVSTKVDVRVLIRIRYRVNYTSEFDSDDVLVSSAYKQSLNGKQQKNIQLSKKGRKYHVMNKGKSAKLGENDINFNALKLYFREPIGVSKIYSENQGKNVSVRRVGQGHYVLIQANGRESHYRYVDGQLNSLTSSSAYGKISIVRQNQNNYASR